MKCWVLSGLRRLLWTGRQKVQNLQNVKSCEKCKWSLGCNIAIRQSLTALQACPRIQVA